MKRLLLLLIGTAICSAGPVRAQSAPAQGDRIRITIADSAVLTGTLRSFSGESLGIEVPGPKWHTTEIAEIGLEDITTFEAVLGKEYHVGRAIKKTTIVTVVTFGVIGLIGGADDCRNCFIDLTAEQGLLVGSIFGALVGVPLGLIIGALSPEEVWGDAPLPGQGSAPATPTPTVTPILGSRVGLSLSIPMGH